MWLSSDKFDQFATLPQRPLPAIGKVANLVCLSTQLYSAAVDASLPGDDGLGCRHSQRASSYYLKRSQRRGMGTNLDTVWGISKIDSM